MLTPHKEPTSTAIAPYKGNKSFLDLVVGGTPKKTPQESKEEKLKSKLKDLSK